MKKRILSAILAVLMVFPLALGVFAADGKGIDYIKREWASKDEKLATMELCGKSENQKLELYVDNESGEMAIVNVETGSIVFSNPHTIALSNVTTREKPYLLSQLDLTYKTISTGAVKTMHSYSDCFQFGQAEITPLPSGDGIKVTYILGEQRSRLLMPYKISVEDMNKILDQFTGEAAEFEKKKILSAYIKYDPTDLRANGFNEAADQAIREYPLSEKIPLYVIKNVNADYSSIVKLITDNTDYTFEQMDLDYEKVREDVDDFAGEERPKFVISATYQVTNEGISAKVDASSVEYDATKYYIESVSILPYFNAAFAYNKIGVEADGKTPIIAPDLGYTFIPDGSGSLVRFEEVFKENYSVKIENGMYGNDYAYYRVKNKNAENLTMPVFGLVNETDKTGFFAIIKDGTALSTVTSSHNASYNSIYTTFRITPTDVYDMADAFSSGSTSSNKISIVADRLYKGICQVDYVLLTDDSVAEEKGITDYYSNTYVGMAKYYRNYLIENGIIDKLQDSEINKDYTKLYLETFGSLKVQDTFMTFPVTVNKELTTFEDIKTIYSELKGEGVGNMSFLLNGFANGGLLSTYPTSLKFQKVLGGDKGFKDLLSYAEKEGFGVVPELEFSYSFTSGSIFSAYTHKKHAVRTLDNRYTTKRTYYAATQTFERTGGVAVSSASFVVLYEKLYDSLSEFDIKFLATRSLGSDLNSDFDKEDYYNREDASDKVVEMLKKLKGEGGKKSYSLILDTGNSYAIPYADAILSASLDSNRRMETSEAIPFFGMVYHGSIEFAGGAFNMEGDTEYMFLKAIENGSTLYFTIAKQNVELLKFEPIYNKYYSVSYDNLKKTIVDTYKEFNGIMCDLQNKYIVNHQFLNNSEATRNEHGVEVPLNSSQVVRVDYEGGVSFVLNYATEDVTVTLEDVNGGESFTIPAFGYAKFVNGSLVAVPQYN